MPESMPLSKHVDALHSLLAGIVPRVVEGALHVEPLVHVPVPSWAGHVVAWHGALHPEGVPGSDAGPVLAGHITPLHTNDTPLVVRQLLIRPHTHVQVVHVHAAPSLVAVHVARVVAGAGVSDHDNHGSLRVEADVVALQGSTIPVPEGHGLAADLLAPPAAAPEVGGHVRDGRDVPTCGHLLCQLPKSAAPFMDTPGVGAIECSPSCLPGHGRAQAAADKGDERQNNLEPRHGGKFDASLELDDRSARYWEVAPNWGTADGSGVTT